MKRYFFILGVLALVAFACVWLRVSPYCYSVIHVMDGDTVKLSSAKGTVTVRLYGVDCPEKKQKGGVAAKQFTEQMLQGKTVKLDIKNRDRYGRAVGVIHVNGTDLNTELVRSGNAWYYSQYCTGRGNKVFCGELAQLEQAARDKHIGLWSDPRPVPPWEFRNGQ